MNNCLNCNTQFLPKRNSTGKYCSRSCAAIVNNRLYPKRKNFEKLHNCLNCDTLLNYSQFNFCSRKCSGSYKRSATITLWLEGKDSGSGSNGLLRACFRNYLLEEVGYKCSILTCRWGIPNPVTKKPILTINHKDGNWKNNKRENLEVLCYNCHTLTDTFGSLNKNGLFNYREGSYRHNKTDNTNG